MGQQCLAGFSVKADDIAFQFPVRNFTEELSQRHDVLLTVAQRWDGYLEIVLDGTTSPAGNAFH